MSDDQMWKDEMMHTRLSIEAEQRESKSELAPATGSVDSLVAAIEGNYSGMSHADLVLTCQMLERGRAIWRKEAEEAKKDSERLNWMQLTKIGVNYNVECCAWGVDFDAPRAITIREAIDLGITPQNTKPTDHEL